MNSRVLLPLSLCCLICASVRAEPGSEPKSESELRALTVLREWSDENQTFTSVRGEFHRIVCDSVFRRQTHADGEFGYLGPRHGFLRFGPPRQKPRVESLKKTAKGTPYQYKDSEPEQWRWQKTRLVSIDEEEKAYQEWVYVNQPKQRLGGIWNFVDLIYEIPADGISPFIPGVPNQARFDDWLKRCHFKVLKESETHIFIAGKPIQRKHAQHFSEFKLYLEKNSWRLKATQYIHPGGNQSTVYTFSNIEIDPLEWDEPDLTGYLNQLDPPEVARRPGSEVQD